MQYYVKFNIGLAHLRHRPGDVTLDDNSVFELIAEKTPGTKPNPYVFNVRAKHDDPNLASTLKLIYNQTGRRPTESWDNASENRDTHFHVYVECLFGDDDVATARWLYLAVPPLSLAEFKAVQSDDTYVVRRVTNRKKIAFGCTDTVGWMMLFTDTLKDRFLESDLMNIQFRPVLLESGKECGLWQIWSSRVMPPHLDYYAGSYRPVVERYEENIVAGLPDFDVAIGAERAGPVPHNMHRRVIVSQRFREVAEALAPGQFKFGLVAVGHGEELKRRYTLPANWGSVVNGLLPE